MHKQSKLFLEQPNFELHDVYRALSVLAQESDFIQSKLYQNSQGVLPRRKDVLYYDCTNYFFEIEEEDSLRKYGKCKQHQPLPIVGMGLFMDYNGIPLAFDIYPGNKNEQPTLKPLEKKVIREYGLEKVIVCTDAGLSSKENRKFNDVTLGGVPIRTFITTQSIKMLPEVQKDFALDPTGWHLPGSNKVYNISELDESEDSADFDKVFYKSQWIKEGLSEAKIASGCKPLEQHLIVSFSLRHKKYLRLIRQGQVERAKKIIENDSNILKRKNQNDPNRFIGHIEMTNDGEICDKRTVYLDTDKITNEEKYDGFYAVCTNLDEIGIDEIIRINKRRWQIEECFRTMKTEFKARPVYLQREDRIKAHFLTCFIALMIFQILDKKLDKEFTCDQILHSLRTMMLIHLGQKLNYIPAYTRTDLTDRLHQVFGFRTDYEISSELTIKRVIRKTKSK